MAEDSFLKDSSGDTELGQEVLKCESAGNERVMQAQLAEETLCNSGTAEMFC